ncbi:MAG: hypothetical protein ACK500_02355 [Flavobacteriales bacterium]
MGRTEFIKAMTTLGIIAVLPRDVLHAQSLNNKTTISKNMRRTDSTIQQIISYGMHAPSSHNTQPWKVKIEGNNFKVFGDFERRLRFADPNNREFLLSISSFIETIDLAAMAIGNQLQIEPFLDSISADKELFSIEVKGSNLSSADATLSLIENRFTDRKNYDIAEITDKHISKLQDLDKENVHYFSSKSPKGKGISELQIDAFTKQSNDKSKQLELSDWLRFDKDQKEVLGDGLFPEMLGLNGLPKFVWYNFFNKNSAVGSSFINQGIKSAVEQIKHTSGFLVITSDSSESISIYKSGRLYQKTLLKCTELSIRNHTISQILEEEPMKDQIGDYLELKKPIQFIIRLGYSNQNGYGKHIRRSSDSIIM